MNCLNVLRAGILQHSLQCIPATNLVINRFRRASPCSYLDYPDRRPKRKKLVTELMSRLGNFVPFGVETTREPWSETPSEEMLPGSSAHAGCFDVCNVKVMRGDKATASKIIPFLYEHYWSREPSVCSLWMNLDNDYLKFLTDKFAYTGDRYLALEPMERTGECKVVGVCVASKIFPWEPRELEEWADATPSVPERSRMYFTAHCYSNPNLWKKYKVPYIYEIEVLTTANEVTGQGVGTLLLKYALKEALLLRHPLIQVICTSQYVSKICERCGMKKEWSMKYEDFVDGFGQSVFYPRSPHYDCDIYIKKFNQAEAAALPCLPEVY